MRLRLMLKAVLESGFAAVGGRGKVGPEGKWRWGSPYLTLNLHSVPQPPCRASCGSLESFAVAYIVEIHTNRRLLLWVRKQKQKGWTLRPAEKPEKNERRIEGWNTPYP